MLTRWVDGGTDTRLAGTPDDIADMLLGYDRDAHTTRTATPAGDDAWLDALLTPSPREQALAMRGRDGARTNATGKRALRRNDAAPHAQGGTQWQASSVAGLIAVDGMQGTRRGAAGGRRRAGTTLTVSFDDLVNASRDAAQDDWCDDDDYELPGDDGTVTSAPVRRKAAAPAGAGTVRARVRPTRVLGVYDKIGGIWDGIMQGLVVTAVTILPFALVMTFFQDVAGKWCTSPRCVLVPFLAVAMSVVGARTTKTLHCDLWDRLITPDVAPAGGRRR